MKNNELVFLESSLHLFAYYKNLGEKALQQIPNEKLYWQFNEDSNSAATIVKHLSGNMLSRWTDFLHADGEKPWRNRDAEFENDLHSREEIMEAWNLGWDSLFQALEKCGEEDFEKSLYHKSTPSFDSGHQQATYTLCQPCRAIDLSCKDATSGQLEKPQHSQRSLSFIQ